MNEIKLLLLLTLFQVTPSIAQNSYYATIASLNKKLLNGYDKIIKPDGQLNVTVDIIVTQIVNVYEKDQIIVLNLWITQSWVDSRLTWDPQDFNDTQQTAIPSDKLWA